MRKRREEGEAMGSDSFLDVVANMVGIVIIMVMVAGLRSKTAPQRAAKAMANSTEVRELADKEETARVLKEQVQRLAEDIAVTHSHGALAFETRNALAFEVTKRKRDLDEKREAMSAVQRASFDLDRETAAAKQELEQLERRKQAAADAPEKTVQITTYATPISHTVDGKEVHFQLRGGLIAHVPMDDFVERIPNELKQQAWKLRQMPEVSSTLGPIDGFRMKYLIVRDGNFIRLQQFELIPVNNSLGESLDSALSSSGEFSHIVGGLNRRKTTVTLWIYPDSFSEFRALKDHLHKLGFATAGRPLPEGQPIGGSVHGSRSAAE